VLKEAADELALEAYGGEPAVEQVAAQLLNARGIGPEGCEECGVG